MNRIIRFSKVPTASLLIVAIVTTPTFALKNLVIEPFGETPSHVWTTVNDPVMGGQSEGTFSITNGLGVFDGTVKIVPSLNAPGFLSMRTMGGYFPDISSCSAIRLSVNSANSYQGFRASFGTNHPAESFRFAMGYKMRFFPSVNNFQDVILPFSDFSDYWDAGTGDQIVTCQEDPQYCPDEATLKNIVRFEVMAEGVAGDVHLEIRRIEAMNCADDAVDDHNRFMDHRSHMARNGGRMSSSRALKFVSPWVWVGISAGFVGFGLITFFIGKRQGSRLVATSQDFGAEAEMTGKPVVETPVVL